MLKENPNTRQHPGEHFRRWFSDGYFDLIVWLEEDRTAIFGFQLCYDVCGNEHSLTWKSDAGFRHEEVDSGEEMESLSLKRTPVMLPDGAFPYKKVLDEFLDRFPKQDREILLAVYDKIIEYTNSGGKLM